MSGDELGVEQGEAAIFQPRHEIDECDFARIAHAGEHALAEEGAAKMNAVESAGELAVLPHFNGVAVAEREQLPIEVPDAPIDPGRAAP